MDVSILTMIEALDDANTSVDPASMADVPWPELRLKASLKHITAASPYAKRILKRVADSSSACYTDGLLHWEPEVVDLQAYKIVMEIIHGRTRCVPRSVDLGMLAKISVIVEELECYEPVEVFSDMWIRHFETSIPGHYCRDLVLWILIAFVFHKVAIFQSITCIAILQCKGPIIIQDLPIRTEITGMCRIFERDSYANDNRRYD